MGTAGSKEIDVSGQSLDNLSLDPDRLPIQPSTITKIFARRNRLRTLPVDITRFEQLVELSIRDNELQSFPLVLLDLTRLKKVSLSFNRITEIPPAIRRWQSLNLLSLAGNGIERLPKEIGELTQLRALDLQRNRLQALPSTIGNLLHLQTLLLQRNELITIPAEIGKCRALKQLNCTSNQLTFLPPTLCALTELEELMISSNRIMILPPGLFTKLAQLKHFDAHTNALTMLPKEVGRSYSLKRLNVAINQLSILPVEIGELKELEWLNANDNKLEAVPPSLGQLRKLKKLGLVQNKIKSLPNEMAQMKSLEKLDLRRNLIETFPPTIRFMPSLTSLLITDNPLCQTAGRQASSSHKGPLSLLELAGRALWADELRSHLHECVQVNVAPALDESLLKLNLKEQDKSEEQAADSVKNGIKLTLTEHLDQLGLNPILKRHLMEPKLCHLCLAPYLKEGIVFIDHSCIRSMQDPTLRLPLRYQLCSELCLARLQGTSPFEATAIHAAGLLAAAKRSSVGHRKIKALDIPSQPRVRQSHSSSTATTSAEANYIMSPPRSPSSWDSYLTPRLTSRRFLTGQGYAWYAFVTGHIPETAAPPGPVITNTTANNNEESLRHWLLDRILGAAPQVFRETPAAQLQDLETHGQDPRRELENF